MTENGRPFYALTPQEALAALGSSPAGLSADEAARRLTDYGPNELTPPKEIAPLKILLRQFANILILILLAATVISFLLGEHLDAYVIMAIVGACIALGFVQEYRAERAAAALRKLAAPEARVRRGGKDRVIPVREVVPGDVLVLHTGDKVAADARLLEQVNLAADEALLTGESTPAGKQMAALARAAAPLGDQACMVFGGTVITMGRGRAVVTATGMATEFGRIARLLEDVPEEKTPLERRLARIGRVLSLIGLGVSVGAALLGVIKGYGWLEMLIWGISLAVAAVPESLPAVVTGALAIGTTRMARRKAIVKRLPAVETMGAITVICTDKTGTLTKNEMTVVRLFAGGRTLEVSGQGYQPRGWFNADDRQVDPAGDPVLTALAAVARWCNDADLEETPDGWEVRGDPTEGALLVLARKAGPPDAALPADAPRVAEIPFDSGRKRMTTVHQTPEGLWAAVKGAPEGLLARCTRMLTATGEEELTGEDREAVQQAAAAMAAGALRVLGLAYRRLRALPAALTPDTVENDLVWVGLAGMMDPPRSEAQEAVRCCRDAGIRIIMITGDHPETAAAIAWEIGLLPPGAEEPTVLTGVEVDRAGDAELQVALEKVRVFARVSSEHKLRLVDLLKERGEVVAMTGDGVNDAPALKRADIGVAMGITGTEVTKETAAMILADDNFATLVAAVAEGRVIFDNIKKYLVFLLSCNLSEILILTCAFFLGLPLPLIALQILWVNLTTDGFPALALGVDPRAPDVMQRPPRPPAEGTFTRPVCTLLLVIAVYLTLVLLPLFAYYYYLNPGGGPVTDGTLKRAQTMVFVTLCLAELVNAFNCRSDHLSVFTVGLLGNRFLLGAVAISLMMVVAVVVWEPLARLFHTTPLAWQDWVLAVFLSLSLVPVVEATKWWLRRSAVPAR